MYVIYLNPSLKYFSLFLNYFYPNMINRILDIITTEDTFKIFSTTKSPTIYDINKLRIRTLSNVKKFLISFFENALKSSNTESLFFSEAFRLKKFVEKLFNEIDDVNKETSGDDNVVDAYVKSLVEFTEDLNILCIKEQVFYITS